MGVDVEFQVLDYNDGGQKIPDGYGLTPVARARAHLDRVKQALKELKEGEEVRLKNGYVSGECQRDYTSELRHVLVSKPKLTFKLTTSNKPESEEELTKEDCLIALAYAAEHDDFDEVKELVECAGKDILRTGLPFLEGTILHVCTYYGRFNTLKRVIQSYPDGVDVYFEDSFGETALHNLSCHEVSNYPDCKEAACFLLGLHGVNVNDLMSKRGKDECGGFTALHRALMQSRKPEVCSGALLDAGKEIEEKEAAPSPADHWVRITDSDGETALHLAVLNKYDDIVSKILEYPGVKRLNLTSLKNKAGNTPLHDAAEVGHTGIFSMLLKYSMEISVKNKDIVMPKNNAGQIPLHIAAAKGHTEVCEKLLEYGSPLDLQDNSGKYPLTNAFFQHHKRAAEKLLDAWLRRAQDTKSTKSELVKSELTKTVVNTKSKQSLINMEFERRVTPLHVAAAIASRDSIQKLLEAGASVNLKSDDGETPLHLATSEIMNEGESNTEDICNVLKKLLKKDASVDLQDCYGETALHKVAARKDHEEVLRSLLSTTENKNYSWCNGRDEWIAMSDFSGETALHKAAKTEILPNVQQLLQAHGRCDELLRVRDMENKTALDWAAEKDNEIMIEEMMKKVADDQMTKGFLMWNLKWHITPRSHHRLCKKYMVEVNPMKLLEAAAKKEEVEIARELINRGAHVPSLQYKERCWLAQNLGKKASDQPTRQDTLGRKALVRGVATLLMNPYTDTPVTVGIFGSWGSGKSSFMLQVEEAMLHMAVKETFRKADPYTSSHDKEASALQFTRKGKILRCMVVKALKQRTIKEDEDKDNQDNESTKDASQKEEDEHHTQMRNQIDIKSEIKEV